MSTSIEEPADEEIIQSIREGNLDGFEQIVVRYKARVFAMASRYAHHGDDLEDLSQAIFIRVWDKLGQYRGDAPFAHWLSRIALRQCYDYLRRKQKRPFLVALFSPDGEPLDWPEPTAPESGGEGVERLREAMKRLNANERLAVTALEIEGRSVREVALATGWSESNVKMTAHRARKKLAKMLEIEQ